MHPFKHSIKIKGIFSKTHPHIPSEAFKDLSIPGYRKYTTDKGKNPKKTGKEEVASIKMPGFVHPENIKEEGYFTQKAKQQLEEMKRKIDKPSLSNPEKQDQ